MTRTIKAIVKFSRDTTANWNRYPKFIPVAGEAIVYSDYISYEENGKTVYVPGIKVGDGHAYLVDLPFLTGYDQAQAIRALEAHENNTLIHVSQQDREKWDNKLNYSVVGEALVFNTD